MPVLLHSCVSSLPSLHSLTPQIPVILVFHLSNSSDICSVFCCSAALSLKNNANSTKIPIALNYCTLWKVNNHPLPDTHTHTHTLSLCPSCHVTKTMASLHLPSFFSFSSFISLGRNPLVGLGRREMKTLDSKVEKKAGRGEEEQKARSHSQRTPHV